MKGSQLNIADAIIGNPAELNALERAIWNSRQGLMNQLGIQSKTALALAPVKLNSQYTGPCMQVRRSSDNAVLDIVHRPNISASVPRNLLRSGTLVNLLGTDGNFGVDTNADGLADGWGTDYSPTGLSISGNVQSFTGTAQFSKIKHDVTVQNNNDVVYGYAYIKSDSGAVILAATGSLPANAVGGNTFGLSSFHYSTTAGVKVFQIYDGRSSGWTQIQVKQCGFMNLTAIFGAGNEPTKAEMDTIIQAWYNTGGGYIETLSATQATSGKANYDRFRDGLYNCLSNGDGRYGLVGMSASGGTLTTIENGYRNTGATRFQQINYGLSFAYLPSPIGGKYSIKATVNAPVGAPNVGAYLANGTDVKSVNITSLITLGTATEITVDIPDIASLGTNLGNRFYFAVVWNNDADAVGKVLEVKNASLIYRGESAARPYYNTPVATLFALTLMQFTDSKGMVLPMGLMPGEMDLDQLMTFVGSSSGFVPRWYGQDSGTKVTLTNLLGRDGNFETDSNADGVGDGWVKDGSTDHTMGNNVQTVTLPLQYKSLYKSISATIGKRLYGYGYIKASGANLCWLQLGKPDGTDSAVDLVNSAEAYRFSSADKLCTNPTDWRIGVKSNTTASVTVQLKQFGVLVLDDIFGTAYIPPKSWLDREIKLMIDTKGYIDTAELVRRNDAYNTTAAQQPRIVNAGVPDFGLMPYFDGSDDRLKVDNAASLDIVNAPLTLWLEGLNQGTANGYSLYRGGNGLAEAQYAHYHDVATDNCQFVLDGVVSSSPSNSTPDNAVNSFGGVWDGATRNSLSNKTETLGGAKTGTLTSRINTIIGARSNAADGSATSISWKGNIGMTLLATVDPTQTQLDKLG